MKRNRSRPRWIAAACAVLFALVACSPSRSRPSPEAWRSRPLPSPKVELLAGTFSDPVAMPATFDPVEMAERLLPFLARNLDCSEKRKGCLPRFETILDRGIESRHANWDFGDLSGRYVEAFLLLRRMTGSREYVEQEESLRRRWLATFGKDGLTYREKTPYSDYEADLFDQSSSLSALVTWYRLANDRETQARLYAMINRMIARLWTLAKHEDGACWFEYPTYLPDGSPGPHRDNWDKADAAHHGGRLLLGLGRYLDDTDCAYDEEMKRGFELAECTVKNLTTRTHEFDPARKEVFSGQMHSRTSTLVGLLEYADKRPAGPGNLFDLGEKVYAYAKSVGTDFGWFPEWADPSHPENPHTKLAEGEITGDMIQAALLLHHYDDAARFARNHFYESQLRFLPRSIVRDDDPKQALGAFAGYAAPNDWGRRTMNCCAGGAAEALYAMWRDNAYLTFNNVNIRNIESPREATIVVKSFLPYRGEIVVTQNGDPATNDFNVRIPSWVDGKDWKATVDGKNIFDVYDYLIPPDHDIRILDGSTARVTFPLKTRVETVKVAGTTYTVTWVGDTVTKIDPPGTFLPLYQGRDVSREPPKVTRRYFIRREFY